MAWFDIGVNLLDSRLDPSETIKLALDRNVTKLCVITTHPNEWESAIQLYHRFPNELVFTLGIHPHNAKDATPRDWEHLCRLASHEGCVAIGECGLDYNRDFSPRDIQRSVFEQQLLIAASLNKPVYLHERDALDDQLHLLDKHLTNLPAGVAHCFTGGSEALKEYVQRNLYIGITGWICDNKRGAALQEAVSAIPTSKLLLETDAPYLFPKTMRPKVRNNQSAFLPYIGEVVAQLVGKSVETVEHTSFENACRLFSLGEQEC